jgi:hypothetical protein
LRRGKREQGGLDPRGILDGAAPADPDSAQTVLDQGQVPARASGASLSLGSPFVATLRAVRIEPLHHVLAHRLELGRVPGPCLLQEKLLGRVAQPATEG